MIELNKIYGENCLVTMGRMPDGFIDLTVTSPPYDNLRTYNGYSFDFESIAKELYRITKQGGVVIWIIGDGTINGSESLTSAKQKIYFNEQCGFTIFDTMIYEKNGPAYPSQDKYFQIFEYMFVLSKGKPKTFNPIIDRKNRWVGQKFSVIRTRRNKKGELSRSDWSPEQGGEVGKRFNIWKYNVGHGYSTNDDIAYNHPATFPEKLAADHIYSWSNENDLVYDPFGGSGTTAKMAHLQKRNWILSEISNDYVQLAEKRLQPYLAQTSLF